MLLRSLLVATISSHRFLLLPALSVLQFLIKPHTSRLLSVDRNPILHGVLKRTFYNQFCAGENEAETRQCVRSLKDLGFRGVILTFARETVFDHNNAQGTSGSNSSPEQALEAADSHDVSVEEWKNGTMETAALVDAGDFLALKLTGAGPRVTGAFTAGHEAPPQMMDALRTICSECKRRGVRVIVDAESQHFQKGISLTTLRLMREFNADDGVAVVYNTYQAYLKRTPAVLAEHMRAAMDEGFTLGLKLVRGAYMLSDDRSLIHDTKQDTDHAYNVIARGALTKEIGEFGGARGKFPFPSTNLFVASHNRESVLGAYRLHRQREAAGLPTVPVSFGQLHGMSDEVSFGLLAEGEKDNAAMMEGQQQPSLYPARGPRPDVFKCTTWGSMSECIAYLMRRAVENRDAASGRLPFKTYIACVRSEAGEQRVRTELLTTDPGDKTLCVHRGDNAAAVRLSQVVILAVDPADVESVLSRPGMADALTGKLLISVAAGWTREQLEHTLSSKSNSASNKDGVNKVWIVRTLPNIAALVSESITAIEEPAPDLPPEHLELTEAIFSRIGETSLVPARLMDAVTAVGGSTPAFFSVICDAMIDAAVAVGLPREMARVMVVQSMKGSAEIMQSGGLTPAQLRDQGTSPEGCTIGGLMVLEEAGVRGHVGRALREAVTVARLMGKVAHVNDTRKS
ncbi:FAD-linked oxidoreductase-like protein [Microdochium trichocladiopsis]|uniref:Proline dehydrogenase n=1 Tax=Microdochium trichocladiopsis TaxID=1682393 RepID=A0A9P8Y639_9PEZI|nr:FAD-linked oxidoreductase-like protein [Microdochium trichocladiopsis]KAH7028777.1 FAD-linked oxidoreductase-like protein [Microdochium trichocladiopsis]